MAYNYQEILRKKVKKDTEFVKKYSELKEAREKVVGIEAGARVTGDITIGRPSLGGDEFVQNFRILRMIGLRWNLAGLLGEKASDGVVYSIGVKLGRYLVSSGVIKGKDAKEFITNFAEFTQNMKIGIPSIVEWKKDFPNIIKVDECITCAGMLNVGEVVCHYEGGIIGGAISEYFKGLIVADEVLCWGKGEETCQFELKEK